VWFPVDSVVRESRLMGLIMIMGGKRDDGMEGRFSRGCVTNFPIQRAYTPLYTL